MGQCWQPLVQRHVPKDQSQALALLLSQKASSLLVGLSNDANHLVHGAVAVMARKTASPQFQKKKLCLRELEDGERVHCRARFNSFCLQISCFISKCHLCHKNKHHQRVLVSTGLYLPVSIMILYLWHWFMFSHGFMGRL